MTLNKNEVTGVLKISGTLDIDLANSLREALLECLVQQHDVAADLSDVDGCDAAASSTSTPSLPPANWLWWTIWHANSPK